MNIRRRFAVTGATLLLPALLLASGAASAVDGTVLPRSPEASDEELPVVDIEFEGIEPMILTDGDTAVITARITNTGAALIDTATVRLEAQGWTPNSRSSALRWLDPDDYFTSLDLGTQTVEGLAPSGTVLAAFEIPAASFAFDTWGPRGIEISVETEGTRVDSERSYVLWWNEPGIDATSLNVLAPVSQTSAEIQAGSSDRLAELLGYGGTAGITLAVDPSVPTGFLIDAVSLPWQNADPEALIPVNPDRYSLAIELAGEPGRPVVTWLDHPSDEILSSAANLGDAILVPSDSLTRAGALTYTSSAMVDADGQPLAMIDTGLAEILAGDVTSREITYELNDAERRQLFAAMTAVITRERPFDSRTILTALPWNASAADAGLVAELMEVPWVNPLSLSDVLDVDPNELEIELPSTSPLPEGALTRDELEHIDSLLDLIQDLSTLSPAVSERLEPGRAELTAIVTRAYRADPAARDREIGHVEWLADYYADGVEVVGPTEPLNMISSESEFPLYVENFLPHPIEIVVSLESGDDRMQVPDPVKVEIPAAITSRVAVPVEGVGWGDFDASATVSTVSGRELTAPFLIDVRMRANWEDVGLIAIVTLAVGSLAVGIWRTVTRNRRTNRSELIEAAAAELDVINEAERSGDTRRAP